MIANAGAGRYNNDKVRETSGEAYHAMALAPAAAGPPRRRPAAPPAPHPAPVGRGIAAALPPAARAPGGGLLRRGRRQRQAARPALEGLRVGERGRLRARAPDRPP